MSTDIPDLLYLHHSLHPKSVGWNHSYYDYIRSGYRSDISYYQCIQSIIRIHNETMNIWTHLCGCFLFLYFALYTDETVFCCIIACAFLCSASYHIFVCNSQLYMYALLLDVSGIFSIILAVIGSIVHHITSTIILSSYSNLHSCLFYSLLISGWFLSILDICRTRHVRGRTVFISIALAITYWFIPILQLCILGQSQSAYEYVCYWGKEYVLWISSFILFLLQFPECMISLQSPRIKIFDYALNSHFWFHVGVVYCAVLHLHNLQNTLQDINHTTDSYISIYKT